MWQVCDCSAGWVIDEYAGGGPQAAMHEQLSLGNKQ